MIRSAVICLLVASVLGKSIPKPQVAISYANEDGNNRVYGGQDADLGEYPSQVSLILGGLHNCGGTIISENWILTAAHCVVLPGSMLIKVRTGTNKWGDGVDYDIASIYAHPGFNFTDFTSEDIGLIEVTTPIVFNDVTQPATLPAQDQETAAGSDAIIVGWGLTQNSSLPPIDLQEGFVIIREQQECFDAYAPDVEITNAQICADVPEGGIGVCSGDSGGPLYVNNEIVGIVSWSANECASQGFPGVFTKVASYRDWITENSGV